MNDVERAIGESLDEATRSFTSELLSERSQTHGKYSDHARATQALKNVVLRELHLRNKRGQIKLQDIHRESIDMILHKIGRIIAGDPDFDDHWEDIAGYAQLCTTKEGHK